MHRTEFIIFALAALTTCSP